MRRPALLLTLLAVAACTKDTPQGPYTPQPPQTRPSGLVVQVLRPGTGDEATQGAKVQVHYVGTLADGGVFDSSRARGTPFAFWVGERQVIEGWDEGILGMKEGEVRKLTVPPGLAYGESGHDKIPPHATLTFEVELVNVR